MLNYKSRIMVALTAFVFILSCGEKIPVKEMAMAKMEISRALSVMAKKYAPQEIAEAEKKLLESHNFIKEDSLDKSKDSAIISRKKAEEAYNKSIPLLAKDTLDIAKQSLDQAEALYAEVLAESEYKQAKEAYAAALALYEQKEYYASYEKSLQADGLAKEARNVAIGKKEILSKSIAEVKAILAEAEKYNALAVAPDKVKTAKDNLSIAEESYKNLELKKGFAAMEIAGTNADEAYLLALKETAKVKLDEAGNLFSEAEKSEGAATAKDELNGAKEALNQSKSQFQDSKYKESILSSDESMRMSGMVLGSLRESAKGKIAGAEAKLEIAKNSVGAAIAVEQLNGAKEALETSRSQFKESKYKESIASAEESERLSNIVINTKAAEGKGAIAKGGKGIKGSGSSAESIFSEDYFIYKVRYIPQRRDCLWRIAEKYYRNPLYWQNIYKANTDKIRNPNLIWPNMLIKVPKLKGASQEAEKETAAPEKIKEQPAVDKMKETEIPGIQKESPAAEPQASDKKDAEPVPVTQPAAEKETAPVPAASEAEKKADVPPVKEKEAVTVPAPEAEKKSELPTVSEKEAIPAPAVDKQTAPANTEQK
ncbi:MAG: LysM peptidoglycan-binding domain-containing protein [Spirochaetota bacterium]